jgi:chromate transporter
MNQAPQPPLWSLGLRFLRFGTLAWGGPVAQIGALHHELVQRERWVDEARFRQVLAVYQALPGPEATEMCIWFGTLARGRVGGLVAGLCFLLPGLSLMLLASWLLLNSAWPIWLLAAFAGMQAAVVGLVARAAWRLCRAAVHGDALLGAIATLGALGGMLDAPFAVSLIAGGLLAACWHTKWRWAALPILATWITILIHASLHGADVTIATIDDQIGPTPSSSALFITGLRAGSLTFGGAYTAIPFLQADAVGATGWMTLRQFLDGLAVGGVMPSPLVIFGTWVGFAGGGLHGALLLTFGIFLPAFTFPLLLHRQLEHLVANPRLHQLLDGITAAVTGLIAAVGAHLASTLSGLPSIAIAICTLIAVCRCTHRLAVLPIMAAAAIAGWLTH